MDTFFSKSPKAKDLRLELKEIDRQQKIKKRELKQAESRKEEKIKETVAVTRSGEKGALGNEFRVLRQIEMDIGYLNVDLRRLSLARTALSMFLKKMESQDRKSLQELAIRFRESPIQKAIDSAEIDDPTFNRMLKEVFENEKTPAADGQAKTDPLFKAFEHAVSKLAEAEDAGADEQKIETCRQELDKAIKASIG
jgi:hypothetical protein